jgi:type IV pilus biogenesis protein CpaD/CtpE
LYSLLRHACTSAFNQAEAFENKSPTLAPTSGELTSTFELMASFSNQVVASSATKLVLPITGGSSSEPVNKKQKKEAQRRVQHVGVQGPFIKSKWSRIPITFS